jgi:uncharacterized protein YbaP (TraB family)
VPAYPLSIRNYFIVIAVSLFSLSAFAQQKSNYSLLWKITGKGLSNPSYLFGTMHVKDKRVFNFSDSVMLALQSCKRFSLEVHPDTVMVKMFALLQNKDTLRSIDKLLSKEDYNKLAKKFQKKKGYAMTRSDPLMLESLMEDEDKPEDKISFVDAYLYGIARTLNKGIYGLEDASSQINEYFGSQNAVKERLLDLIDDDTEAAKDEGKEDMVQIYSTGDLDAIYDYAVKTNMLDSSIIARNKVMAGSMIKYMSDEPLFTAIGAAHLPGPDGVIALLRKAGYTVTRVQASFTGIASTFHIDYMKMNWPVYKDETDGYSIEFPGAPIKNSLYGTNNVIYPDMANSVYYCFYALPRGTAGKPANHDEVINKLLANLKDTKNDKLLSRQDFVFDKIKCTDVLLKTNDGYMRMRLLLANNLLYSAYVTAKYNHLREPQVNRFFNSFRHFPITEKTAKPWIPYTNTIGAFAVNLPVKPQEMTKHVPSKMKSKEVMFKMNLYLSTDTVNSTLYLVRFNDYPAGTFLSDKQLLFNSLVSEFNSKGKSIGEPVKIWKDGYEGRELKIILTGGYNGTVRLYVKGNRVYILLKEILDPDVTDKTKVDPFFESFKFLPTVEPEYYTLQPDSENFKVQLVLKPEIAIDSSERYASNVSHIKTYYSTNPNSGGVYAFEYSKLSPYYRVKNIDSLLEGLTHSFITYRDTLLKVDTVTVNGLKGRELITQNKETHDKRRTRIFFEGNNLFYFTGHMDSAEYFNKASEVFYNSLVISHPSAIKMDLSASKAAKICNDISSPDSLVAKNALGAIYYYDFTAAELPYLYSALRKSYPDDTSILTNGTRYRLIRVLKKTNNDTTTTFLVSLYHTLKGKDDLKAAILNTIPNVDKKTGYETYLNLLTTDAPVNAKQAYEALAPFSDSTAFAAQHFDKMLPYLKYENYRKTILEIARNITVTKKGKYNKVLLDSYTLLMAYAQSDIDKYLALKDSSSYKWNNTIYDYFKLMNSIKVKAINDKLTKRYLLNDPKGSYASDAVIARIYNQLPNNQLLINRYLDSIGTRYYVMDAYNDQNQLAHVPLAYRRPEAFAKLCLFQQIASDDYGNPAKITLLGTILQNGYIYYVFKYILPDNGDNKHLIGIVGPYKQGSTKLKFEKYDAYTGYDELETNWRLQASKMVKPLLDSYK